MSAMTNTPNTPAPVASPADVADAVVKRLEALADERDSQPEPEPEVTGYGYLTEDETAAAIRDHERAVKNAKG